MSTYVLVHGGWHGQWCWDKVTPLLRRAGHQVVTFDLPAHGEDTTPLSEVTFDLYVQRTCEVLAAQTEPVILVGHSSGGNIISVAAERTPMKIEKLVYLTAYLLRDGETIRQNNQNYNKDSLLAPNALLDASRTSITLRPEKLKEILYGDCSDEDIARAKRLLVPEALQTLGAPVHVTAENFGRIPRVYIQCLQDRANTLPCQRHMYTATPCQQVLTLDTSHSSFFSAPQALSERLLSV
jgi:pimeloyl-ACP methyl ester carboxylesterase